MRNIVSACLMMLFLLPLFAEGQSSLACELRVEGDIQHPSCQGGMDGAINIRVSGGAAPYTYRWNSGQETAAIDQLMGGTYKVNVRDSQGCELQEQFIVVEQSGKKLTLQVEQQPATANKKILKVRFVNGLQPYAVQIKKISDGYRTPQIAYTGQALTSGIYLLEAFTAAGCSVYERVKIEAN